MTEQEKAILRALWEVRGTLKGLANKLEKELSPFWEQYLKEENKSRMVHIPSETISQIGKYDTDL